MRSVDDQQESDTDVDGRRDLAVAYGLLGRFLSAEIDADFLASLSTVEMQRCLISMGIQTDELTEESLGLLAVDYCQTFLGPRGHVSLHQSVAQTGLLDGPAVASMKEFLQCVRVPVRSGQMVDHLGLQLTVYSAILSAADGQEEPVGQMAEQFFDSHVRWGSEVCRRASLVAQTDFYRAVLSVTIELIESGIVSKR